LLGIKIVKEKAIALRVIPEQPEEAAMRENSRIHTASAYVET
jgi:hypothetical protein